MSEKNYAAIVVILYAVLVLISLGDPAMVLAIGHSLLGEHLDLFLSLVPYGIISLLLVYLTFVTKEARAGRFFFLMVISVILFFVVRHLNGEREKVHLIEFGLLGGLIFWSAALWGFRRPVAYLVVVTAGPATVGFDELLQTSLSLKVFSERDVLVNIMAVAIGAVIYGGLFLDSTQNEGEAKTSS